MSRKIFNVLYLHTNVSLTDVLSLKFIKNLFLILKIINILKGGSLELLKNKFYEQFLH